MEDSKNVYTHSLEGRGKGLLGRQKYCLGGLLVKLPHEDGLC